MSASHGCCIVSNKVGEGGGEFGMGGKECGQDGVMVNCGGAGGGGGGNSGGVGHQRPGGIGGGIVRSDGHGCGWERGRAIEVCQWRFLFNEGSGCCVGMVER